MATIQHNARLERLLQDLNCSLLQYAGEASPWSSAGPQVAGRLEELVARQRKSVQQMVDLLSERRWPLRTGIYDMEFGDLQFLSIKYLLPRLISNEQALVAELEEAVHTMSHDDPEASALAADILASERSILDALPRLEAENISA